MPPSLRSRLAGISALALALLACGGDRPHRRARQPPLVPAAVGRPVIDWVRGGAAGERVVVGEGGVAVGPAAGPLTRAAFASPEELGDLRFFAASFAPFAETAGGERFAFAGRGAAAASPAERRMVREWARRAVAGGSGERSVYGLALAWRGGPLACDGLSVFLSGEVRAGHCDWRQEVRGRLAGEPLARLYRWFDAYRPFQVDALGAGRAALPTSGLIFAGRGKTPAPAGERTAISDFAAALHRELAARRAASLPPVRPPSPMGPQPAAAKSLAPSEAVAKSLAPPEPPPAPGPSLLRPDLPPPAPATTPITPIPPLAPSSAQATPPTGAAPPDREGARGTEAPAHPAPAARSQPVVQQEEDEAPLQGTEPGH